MALGAQIRKYRSKAGLTLEQLSELSGVEVGTINALENRDSSRSGYGSKLAAALGMSVEMLQDEAADHDVKALMLKKALPVDLHEPDGAVVRDLAPAPGPGAAAVRVPLLANSGSMGPGSDVHHDDVLVGHIALSAEWVSKRLQPTSNLALRFIHAYGDSMQPTFTDGDVLLVDTGARDPSRADGVYVLSTSQRIFIKRVTGRFDGGFDVSSDNPTVKTIGTLNGGQDIDVLGRVVWAWNGKKL